MKQNPNETFSKVVKDILVKASNPKHYILNLILKEYTLKNQVFVVNLIKSFWFFDKSSTLKVEIASNPPEFKFAAILFC